MSCMYVWLSILPMQATEKAHSDIPTRTDAVSESASKCGIERRIIKKTHPEWGKGDYGLNAP